MFPPDASGHNLLLRLFQLLKDTTARNARDWVSSLGWEDLLEKEMATHSSIPTWETPWTEEPGGLQSMGSHKVRYDLTAEPQQRA